jgi:hypothetical protein
MGGMGGQRRGVSNLEIWLMIHGGLGTQVTVVTSLGRKLNAYAAGS